MKKKYIALFIAVALALVACGGRVPTSERSQKIIQSFFKKYANKHPDTVYGQSGVTKVEVERQTEIRKKFAAVDAYITLGDGSLKKIHATVEKGPMGWRFVSWEDATGL